MPVLAPNDLLIGSMILCFFIGFFTRKFIRLFLRILGASSGDF